MITAIQIHGLMRFLIEMKNFIPRWLHFVPRFPQAKRNLEMCQFPQRHWPLLSWFSRFELPQGVISMRRPLARLLFVRLRYAGAQ
jgi:hypothetical protein